jgi:uncharacterized integral membrane protein
VSEHQESPTPAEPAEGSSPSPSGTQDPLRGSRTSAAWSGVVGFGLLLVLLIIFIAQNTQKAEVNFLGWSGTAPVAVSLLIAAAIGLALAVTAASLRILQLRRRVRRTR